MQLFNPPLIERLSSARRVLIAGAGGGFDIFCGLPLFFALERAGCEVFLANLTFSNLHGVKGFQPDESVIEVTAETEGGREYFPEKYLCQWFKSQGREVSVFCLHRTGVVPLTEAYRALTKHLRVDALLLIDGGTDSLMRGDETSLGTPAEDASSLIAASAVSVDQKYLVCLGFGVDRYHGVCHAQFLEAVSALSSTGAFLGVFSLIAEMPEARQYIDAVNTVCARMPTQPSIVNTSIVSAIEGYFGDHHRTDRTAGSTLWINPLMSMYWTFELDPVTERLLYRDFISDTRTFVEIILRIEAFRKGLGHIRDRDIIPV